MAHKPRRWQISPSIPTNVATTFSTASYTARTVRRPFHPVIAQILYNRGFTDAAHARAFLEGVTVGNPFDMRGIAQAVSRIRIAIRKQEPIVVYGDFDADGVTSTALLVTTLRALGANVRPYIPHRVDEGYGLNGPALCKLAEKGMKLIITVDCGIRSVEEVEIGKQAGLDMIVTDHHSVGPELPRALAVINPKQPDCKYPEKMLAGVGVTFKLAEALLQATKQNDRRNIALTSEDLLDLVAIGTVADLVPMNSGENRQLVTYGLEQIKRTKRPGLQAMMEVAVLTPAAVNAMAIGFTIGPRLNAAGRLESAMSAYELLSTEDPVQAMQLAVKLQTLNEERQRLTREAQEHARIVAGADKVKDLPLIFAIDGGFKQGIVGLVAGKLAEEFYRPAIVMHRGAEQSHGSCRSIIEFNITEALDQCADLLLRHGGHAQAAGFAIANENLPDFQERIMEIAATGLRDMVLLPHLNIDAEVPFNRLDLTLYEALMELEPCGHGFPAPILCTRGLKIADRRTVGKENAHLKLKLTDGTQTFDAIGFRLGELMEDLPPRVDVAYELDMNEWKDQRQLQLKLQDIRPATT